MGIETPPLLPDAIAVSLDIVSKESLAEKIISVDFIGVLLGVILGGLVTFGTQYFVDKRRAEEQKKALSAAFFGEIYSLLKLAQKRKYFEMIVDAVIYINEHNSYYYFDKFFTMKFNDYFSVYRQNVKNIGTLDADITPLLTEFYIKVLSLLEDLTVLPGSILQNAQNMYSDEAKIHEVYVLNLRRYLMDDITLIHEAIVIGKQLCEKLSQTYNLDYKPIFENLRPEEDIIADLDAPINFALPSKNSTDILYGKQPTPASKSTSTKR